MEAKHKPGPCPASGDSTKKHPALKGSFVGDVVLCPLCSRPVRVKLAGTSAWPGRYEAIPRHTAAASEGAK